ncbi:ATP-binding cassette, subfamily B [Anaerobranca californiensis DSM 14826]|jgi:ATP-binding cassette subfamily B protein|uniref:ATP-binding cassette, subfamily B n=1 Tax=Anaerobranca californiensis DSM 14826 TaxID=1120989 RepID=A0A1M6QDJ8_9FIRM|nr:ABC transporter ATP-binding protein [Anaerobranca californiensis]SHK18266.1 ATP-binding cassette, subfamily B [Anaerobranca californiensis DSM 14826]
MGKNTFKEDEKLKETLNLKIIFRLFEYIKPYKLQVVITLILMGIVIAVSLANPLLMRLAINRHIAEGDISGLIRIGIVMALINFLAMYAARYRIMIMAKVSSKILLKIRQELFAHIQKLSFSFFDNRPVGKILARIIGDVDSLGDLFTNSVTSLIPDAITLVAVMAIMLYMNWQLGLLAIIMLPILALALFYIQIYGRKRWQDYRKKRSNLSAFLHEDYSGIKVIQSFNRQSKTERVFSDLAKKLTDSFISAVRLSDAFWPVVELSWGIGSIIVFWYGVRLLNTGTIQVGDLVAFTGYIGMFWRPIMNLSNFYNLLITNLAGAERIFEIMDIIPDIVDTQNAKELPQIIGEVEFKNVSFAYEDGEVVLKNVSFKVQPGETIALVGHTGAGKTTIVNLLTRFYDITEGEILVDGYNIKDVTIESLRSQMGIMSQDTFMFSGSIKENIRYGKLDATDEQVINAAKAVQAHDFITKLENGYDTDVNERGSRLSVGQRQLIALARALLANPRILILDEATSSIDTQTEKKVQLGLNTLLAGRTSFVIAHRLSTIRNAHRIMVIDDGQIKEIGNHQQLLAKKGIYYKLYTAQYKFLHEGA